MSAAHGGENEPVRINALLLKSSDHRCFKGRNTRFRPHKHELRAGGGRRNFCPGLQDFGAVFIRIIGGTIGDKAIPLRRNNRVDGLLLVKAEIAHRNP